MTTQQNSHPNTAEHPAPDVAREPGTVTTADRRATRAGDDEVPTRGSDPDRTQRVTVFEGARRVRRYAEAAEVTPPPPAAEVPAPEPEPLAVPEPVWVSDPAPPPASPAVPAAGWARPPSGVDAAVAAPVQVLPATWGWRGRCNRASGGLFHLKPAPAELAHRDAVATIGRATWTRAVNVVVANSKGGVGKTPTGLILGGILGHVRGGSVLVWEATDTTGTLTARAEGTPVRGLEQLVGVVEQVRSAGHLSGYTAPQTSHADVLGSVGSRWGLTGPDVLRVRRLVDTYYRITITDTGNNPVHDAYRAAVATADAVVIPCLLSGDSLAGLEEIGEVLRGTDASTGHDLLSRVVVILGHDGGPENRTVAAAVRARLDEIGLPVVEVPYDPIIRDGGPLTLDLLSEASSRAWTQAAATVVTALRSAPTSTDLVHQALNGSAPRYPGATTPPTAPTAPSSPQQ